MIVEKIIEKKKKRSNKIKKKRLGIPILNPAYGSPCIKWARNGMIRSSPLSIDAQRPSCPEERQAPSHPETIPQNIQLAALDFSPPNGHFRHGDLSELGQHEHLHIEDPALGMHIWDDVRQCRTRKQLKATLCILDGSSSRRRHEPQNQVERVHQKVAQFRSLKQSAYRFNINHPIQETGQGTLDSQRE